MRRCISLGCGFSLSGLRYSLRKPTPPSSNLHAGVVSYGRNQITEVIEMSNKARLNYALDAVIAIAFILSSLSGIAFMFMGTGGYQGGRNPDS